MSTTNSVVMALDTTTTTPVLIPATMAKEDVLLVTGRSVDTDTVAPTPSNNVDEYRLALTTSNVGFFVPSSCQSVSR